MGKAQIVRHIENSRYEIIYFHDMTKILLKLGLIEDAITANNLYHDKIAVDIEDATVILDELEIVFNSAISLHNLCLSAPPTEGCGDEVAALKKANKDFLVQRIKVTTLIDNKDTTLFKQQSLKKDKALLSKLTGEEQLEAWCIDVCDRPASQIDDFEWENHGEIIPNGTEVGTIDIFDFSQRKYIVNIRAASFERDPTYDLSFDGLAASTLANSGTGFVYNYNMRGPQATWNPKYRLAIVNEIKDGVAQLTYNALKDQDGVRFNTMDHLADTDIPTDYMICPLDPPFKIGDQVIVTFAGDKMASPSIIGYAKNPKRCEPPPVVLYTCPTEDQFHYGWGAPFYDTEDPPVAIDEPFGSELGQGDSLNKRHKASLMVRDGDNIQTVFAQQHKDVSDPVMPGNVGWVSDNDKHAVSYWGRSDSGYPAKGFCRMTAPGDIVYSNAGEIPFYHLIEARKITSDCTNVDRLDTPTLLESHFDIIDMFTLSESAIWYNGIRIPIQGLIKGTKGSLIIGASVYSGHLFYVECVVSTEEGGRTGAFDYMHSIRLSDLSYSFLGTYRARADRDPDNTNDTVSSLHNAAPLRFNGDGSMFIGHKGWSVHDDANGSRLRRIDGRITYDTQTDSISANVTNTSFGSTSVVLSAWNYGFDRNDDAIFDARPGTIDHALEVYYSNPKYNCIIGIYQNHYGPSAFEPTAIIVQYEDDLWEIDISNGQVGYYTVNSVWDDFYGYGDEAFYWANGTSDFSCIANHLGIFLSLGSQLTTEFDYDPFTNYRNYNVWIKPNGDVDNLGGVLLNGTANGTDFGCRPMVLNK